MSTDAGGRIPKEGNYVAYNHSGQISTGYIAKVGGGRHGPIYHIDRVLPPQRWNYGNEKKMRSVVRGGPRCVLVLEDLTNPQKFDKNTERREKGEIE